MRRALAAMAALLLHLAVVAAPVDPRTQPAPSREEPIEQPDPVDPAPPPPADPIPAPVTTPIEQPPELRNPHPFSMIKHTPTTIAICQDEESRDCRATNMPAHLGNVERYVHGPFVTYEIAQASWLAITSHTASVCYMAAADNTIDCIAVKASVPEKTDIRYRNPGSDLGLLAFSRAEPTEDKEGYYLAVRMFSQAVMEAATELQAKAQSTSTPVSGRPRFDPMKIDNTVPVTPDGSYWESMEGSTWTSGDMPTVTISAFVDRAAAIIGHPDQGSFPGFLNVFSEHIGYTPPKPGWPIGWKTQVATTRCIHLLFLVYCTAPRAPPLVDPLLQPDPRPISFPSWSLCKATGFYCAASDEVKRAEDLELRLKLCEKAYEAGLEGCERRKSDYRSELACKQDRFNEYSTCRAEAGRRNKELYD